MRKILMSAACIVALAGGAAHAATATWDFEADATAFRNAKNFEGTFGQVYGGTSTKSGITLGASAYLDSDLDGSADPTSTAITPFMDAGNAGLGVCKTGFNASVSNGFGGESRCSTQYSGGGTKNTADDNLVFPEILKLAFSGVPGVAIDDLYVRDKDHGFTAGTIRISTDGINFGNYSIAAGTGKVTLTGLGAASMFWFTSTTDARPQIYLDTLTFSSVPVPAALPLLLAGLGGLGFMARRKRKAA